MVHFAESAECRRAALLRYFGETYPEANCGSCDNCLNPKVSYDATLAAQKYLSCVYRIREKSGFAMGMAHVADVLTGKDNEKVRRFGHEKISTYGIGKDMPGPTWNSIGRELVRIGYLRQVPEIMNAVELTAEGKEALKQRKIILLNTRQPKEKVNVQRQPAADEEYNHELFEDLRTLRKKLADKRSVPAYVIFSDVTLRHIARDYPENLEAFRRISGVGEKKLAEFGEPFIAAVREYLRSNPK